MIVVKIIFSFVVVLIFSVVFFCCFLLLGLCIWKYFLIVSDQDFDEEFLWRDDEYTFTGPFYYDEYYEQWFTNTSWAIEFEDYFSDDEEDSDEDFDMEEEYFDKSYLETLDQTWVWRNKFGLWLLKDPEARKIKNNYDISFFVLENKSKKTR